MIAGHRDTWLGWVVPFIGIGGVQLAWRRRKHPLLDKQRNEFSAAVALVFITFCDCSFCVLSHSGDRPLWNISKNLFDQDVCFYFIRFGWCGTVERMETRQDLVRNAAGFFARISSGV